MLEILMMVIVMGADDGGHDNANVADGGDNSKVGFGDNVEVGGGDSNDGGVDTSGEYDPDCGVGQSKVGWWWFRRWWWW